MRRVYGPPVWRRPAFRPTPCTNILSGAIDSDAIASAESPVGAYALINAGGRANIETLLHHSQHQDSPGMRCFSHSHGGARNSDSTSIRPLEPRHAASTSSSDSGQTQSNRRAIPSIRPLSHYTTRTKFLYSKVDLLLKRTFPIRCRHPRKSVLGPFEAAHHPPSLCNA